MRVYLWYSESETFSDSMESLEASPFPAPEGAEWRTGQPPEETKVYKHQTLPDKLDSVFMQLPPEVRAQFYPLKAGVKLALEQGDTLGALAVISLAQVPKELEAAKDAMLSLFPEE